MNDDKGEPLCIASSSGRWVKVVSYDDTGSGGHSQRLLFKTWEEAAECAQRLNEPWNGFTAKGD